MNFPKHVNIVEVGPRDGLQNEKMTLPTDLKIAFINQLSATGLKTIEATSFVSPKWIPQLADAGEVLAGITHAADVAYPVLVPNARGMENAIKAGAKCVAIFTASSETFSKKNTNSTLAESMTNIAQIMQIAQQHKIPVRGYISCALGCPYEGRIAYSKTAAIAEELIALGCYEISLGDTIGVGTPFEARQLITTVTKNINVNKIAVHFHDTYGQALANIYAVLEQGISVIDSSVAGLGGCPYAQGASGNVATEDVVYMLNGMGINTGVDIEKLLLIGQFVTQELGHAPSSKVALARFG
jgi:hydroxymethylglutaryl-CoA lyase